jgi:peptidoglycan/LPS O-acetylase OafA/YrhL
VSEARVASLDFVRGAAAVCVAGAHFCVSRGVAADEFEIVSTLAVEVFFVLSGFVLAPQILFCLSQRRWDVTRTFLVRRWMRTVPPFIVALICATALFRPDLRADFYRYLFYVQNLFRQHNTQDYFSIAWSLSIEEWFYVVFPITLIALVRIDSRRNVLTFCAGFVAIVFVLRMMFGDSANWGPAVRRVVVFRIDSIVFGFLLYLFVDEAPRLRRLAVLVPFTVAAFFISFRAVASATAGGVMAGQAFPFLGAAFGGGVVALGYAAQGPFERPGVRSIAAFLGRISYSLYLFHVLWLALLGALPPTRLGIDFIIYVMVSGLFCAAFYEYFEKPIMAARPRYPRADRVPAPTTAYT